MPKENTHLDFALDIAEHSFFKNFQSIQSYPIVYRLGAVFPDICYYSRATYGDCIHRGCGAKTPKDFLLAALEADSSPKTLAFTLGYLTHYLLDVSLHPYINELSSMNTGFDMTYNHRWIETTFDALSVSRNHLKPFYTMKNFSKINALFMQAAARMDFKTNSGFLPKFLFAQSFLRKKPAYVLLKTFSTNSALLSLSYHHKPYPLSHTQLQKLEGLKTEAKNTIVKTFSNTREHTLYTPAYWKENITSRSLDSGLPIE